MPKRKADSDEESEQSTPLDAGGTSDSDASATKAKSSNKKEPTVDGGVDLDLLEEATAIFQEIKDRDEWIVKSTGGENIGKIRTNAEGDKYIDLGKKKRAVVRSFKGIALLDIREYYGEEGDEKPGKKGISLQLEQWQALRDESSAIDDLFVQLKK